MSENLYNKLIKAYFVDTVVWRKSSQLRVVLCFTLGDVKMDWKAVSGCPWQRTLLVIKG